MYLSAYLCVLRGGVGGVKEGCTFDGMDAGCLIGCRECSCVGTPLYVLYASLHAWHQTGCGFKVKERCGYETDKINDSTRVHYVRACMYARVYVNA